MTRPTIHHRLGAPRWPTTPAYFLGRPGARYLDRYASLDRRPARPTP